MPRNKTKQSAIRIGRIAAILMIPANASAAVFEFDEAGAVTRTPPINYLQRERLKAPDNHSVSQSDALELGVLATTPVDVVIPTEAMTYIRLPESNRAIVTSPQTEITVPATSSWIDVANAAAVTHSIPPALFRALVRAESGFNPKAVSKKGAIGLTQLMPATAKALGVDPNDPLENLDGGARYLSQQYERFGSWPLALAAYNAGPTRVAKLGRVPNIPETKTFVARVMRGAGLASKPITTDSN